MDYINAIIFGTIQGITEFLPISSSGHLTILHNLISMPIINILAFDVALHLATLFAVAWFFRNDIKELFIGWLKSFRGGGGAEARISWLIITGTIPAALAGYFFENFFQSTREIIIVIIMLIIGGILLIIAENIGRKSDSLNKLNLKKSLIIGFAQALALVPGTSRSGITIIAGLAIGLKREAAVRFSMLLSVPIIFGAAIKKVPILFGTGLIAGELLILALAFIAAFIAGFYAIRLLVKISQATSLKGFAVYRFVLASILIIILVMMR